MNDLLFGVDPAEVSVPALVWAADEAARRRLRLRLVVAVPPVHDRLRYDALGHRTALRIRAESALADVEELVRRLHGPLPTNSELVDGAPATVLMARAAEADLVVVGSRRLGRAAELLGESSVVVPLTARAPCPVVVVRAPEHTEVHPPTLVVGVDGSERSRDAVAFAVREAGLREARLRAVWVWPRPLLAREDTEAGLSERRRLLAESVAGWTEQYPDTDITQDIVRGHPVEQLVVAARDSLALVVGRTGRGGYTGMRLGSTVHGLLHHADCPVIVVPSGTPGERDGNARGWAERPPPVEPDRPAPG
ncbi:universal stress protein [Streptomyces sp. NE5-10]|uniref:universal stress protein n=1 Tax=Streptomyces sp. NE5-10 TaxID=2759674 RepID=UPI001904CCBC|nr:universal stress protein [Streptomyces sp. NE5-10]GHJ96871.1 universal stress protein [Streptomyces sp. NE5-10]